MELEDYICETVARLIATERSANCYTSQSAMIDSIKGGTEEIKYDKELRTVIRKLLNEE